ncbi:3-hydroxybutyryl-CoA dehydratase [Gammaproteobacteria bacterium]|nr:3-hydroxybutyryl-CoA dehydratase [Gammaproteobacteria bacterium]
MPILVSTAGLAAYVGRRLVAENWFEIDQARIDRFAEVTGDHQFIHVDPVAARATPFGSTIAHGYLTLSLLPLLLEPIQLQPEDVSWGLNYGLDRLRFLAPVPASAAVRAVSTLLAVEDKGGDRLLMRSEVAVEIRGSDRPALAATTLAMWVLGAPPAA